jgi:hypothetical protein
LHFLEKIAIDATAKNVMDWIAAIPERHIHELSTSPIKCPTTLSVMEKPCDDSKPERSGRK